jgi:hypothetical protein
MRELAFNARSPRERWAGRRSYFGVRAGRATATVRMAFLSLLAVAFLSANVSADDFEKAMAKIDKIKPNIDYNTFCSETPSGQDKIACRIKTVPTVGLLVCKTDQYHGTSCANVIKEEIVNLTRVKKAGLNTIEFDNAVIKPLKCAEQASTNCAGYLVAWVADGKFTNLDDVIAADRVADLAEDIISYTPTKKLPATRSDIAAITNFMTPARNRYSRICDLQGFYLKGGGFLINDVPELDIDVSTKPECSGTPGFDEALAGLNDLAARLKTGSLKPSRRRKALIWR